MSVLISQHPMRLEPPMVLDPHNDDHGLHDKKYFASTSKEVLAVIYCSWGNIPLPSP
jgi:hypothetical protein